MQSNIPDTVDQPSPWERLTLASGIIAGALVIAATVIFIAFIVPHMPPIDAPASQHAPFYAEQSHNPIYKLVGYLGQAQMVFLGIFFGGLLGVLRRAEGGSGSLAAAIFAAGIAIAVISPLAILIEDHLLLGAAAAGIDPVIVHLFDGIGPRSFALSGFPQAVVLGGTGALVLSRRLVPRWIGWMGCVLAVLSLIGTGTLVVGPGLFPLTALAMLLFRIWIIALSIALLRSAPIAREPVSQRMPA